MKRPIDAKRWSDIRAIFDELVELDGAQRSERLLTIGASDPTCGVKLKRSSLPTPRRRMTSHASNRPLPRRLATTHRNWIAIRLDSPVARSRISG